MRSLPLRLRRWFALLADEADGRLPTPALVALRYQAVREAWRGMGEEAAEALYRQEAAAFAAQAGRCPTCGVRGAPCSTKTDR